MALVKVSPLFSNHMVLQRGTAIPFWGESLPNASITVSFLGKKYHTRANGQGKWRLFLDSAGPGGPYQIEIAADIGAETLLAETLLIEDIYIGDVWLCSGQSNMELPMQRLKDDFAEEWDGPINPLVRQFMVPQEWDFSVPRETLNGGFWNIASAATLHEFSGTAWFFAKKIFEKYHVPIGLINTAWGGTPVEAWISREGLAAFPHKIAEAEQYADSAYCETLIKKNEAEIQAWEDLMRREDRGLAEAWQKPETETSQWRTIGLPGDFAAAGLEKFCGVVWLRREFDLGADFAAGEAKLWLGTIVDADTVYVNGVEVGNTTYRYPPRKYPVPAGLLQAGKNTIVIRVVCCNGEGGITYGKDFCIFTQKERIELAGAWKFRTGLAAGPRPAAFFFQRQPMGLYNAMIAPLLDYPCKGVLWYQGESNDRNAHEYAALFTALIKDWRGKKQQDDLPFLFVQLPIFGEPAENNESSSWALIREAQRSALSLPATGMAAGLDLGEWNDLHPINKKDIGYRLALAAERVVFNTQNTAPGPLYRGAQRRQGRLFLSFDNCGQGLTAREKPYVSISSGGALFRLSADIESPECLSVDISSIERPEKVLYAWANNPRDRQLYNTDGLPVIPFRAKITEAAS
jgi:sialate O-acetylesterase